jgi:hypothetical protein
MADSFQATDVAFAPVDKEVVPMNISSIRRIFSRMFGIPGLNFYLQHNNLKQMQCQVVAAWNFPGIAYASTMCITTKRSEKIKYS